MTDEGSEVLVIMVSSIGLGEIPTCYLKLIRKECGVGCGEEGERTTYDLDTSAFVRCSSQTAGLMGVALVVGITGILAWLLA